MAEVTAKDVQRLRQIAGVGMMDAKKALVEAEGDFDKAHRRPPDQGPGQSGQAGRRAGGQSGHDRNLHPSSGRPAGDRGAGGACLRDRLRRQEPRVPPGGRRHRDAHCLGQAPLDPP